MNNTLDFGIENQFVGFEWNDCADISDEEY